MTTRERRENRAQRRDDWAASRRAKADSAEAGAKRIADGIPFGQPILVGHHSERRARRDQDRIHSGFERAHEHRQMADHHERAATTIRRQLDRSIYRDDPDAVERLQEKIAGLEAQRDRINEINGWIRKNRKRHGFTRRTLPGWQTTDDEAKRAAALLGECKRALNLTRREQDDLISALSLNRSIGIPPYATANLSGNLARARKRLEEATGGA